jgi:hypothetical protein
MEVNDDTYIFHVRFSNPHVDEDSRQPTSLGFVEILPSEIFDEEDKVDVAAWHGFVVVLGTKAGNPCVGFRYHLKTGERRNCTSLEAFDTCLAEIEDDLVVTSESQSGSVDIDVLPRYEFIVNMPGRDEPAKIITTDAATASWERLQEELCAIGGKDFAAFHYTRPRRNLLHDCSNLPQTKPPAPACLGDTPSDMGMQVAYVDNVLKRCC